jgi:large subunit ribosomal protein L10
MNASSSSVNVKEKDVNDLAEAIKKAKTLMVASIKGLPSKQFQNIKKSIREHAEVKVAKKNIMMRSLKAAGVTGMDEYVGADCAFVISDLDAYELAGILAKKKTPVYAKAGQIADDDIEVKDGPTDLIPGPAISELGALGLKVAVENGKISIKEPKIVITKGQIINEGAASVFMKLNIMPFNVGLNITAAYDVASKKIFTELKIDPEGYTEELKQAAGKALGFAQKIAYVCKETIGYLLAKANAGAKALEKYGESDDKKDDTESKEEGNTEKSTEGTEGEKSEDAGDNKTENKEGSSESEDSEGPAELNKPEESA